MNMDEFLSKINCKLNNIEGNEVNALANVAINVIIECLDEVAPSKEVTLRDRW